MLNPDEVVYEEKSGQKSLKLCFSDDELDDNVITIRIRLDDGSVLAQMLMEHCSFAACEKRRLAR